MLHQLAAADIAGAKVRKKWKKDKKEINVSPEPERPNCRQNFDEALLYCMREDDDFPKPSSAAAK